MDIFTIAICDDETKMLEKIHASVSITFKNKNIDTECLKFSDPMELLTAIRQHPIDAVFLDIDMPRISGMDIAGIINTEKIDTAIVFVTCHDMLVYDTFQYSPFAFIRKSHFDCEIGGVIDRIISRLSTESHNIILKNGTQIARIKINSVIYIESTGNYVNIHTADGCEKYRDTLSNIEQLEGGVNFIRVHKGFIVNIGHIERLTGNSLIMSNGAEIPMGRNYEKNVKSKILQSFRRQV